MTGACAAAGVVGTGSGGSFPLTLSPTSVSGYSSTGAAVDITTNAVVVTPGGGVSPYTYAWAEYGTPPNTWNISAASAASTAFTATSVPVGNVETAQFEVTVTDAVGSKAKAVITATANNGVPYGPSPSGNNTAPPGGQTP